MDARTLKLLTLAFDERTNEAEAVVAFLKCRNRETLKELQNKPKATNTLINISVSWYHAVFSWGYKKARELGIEGMQINLGCCEKHPESSHYADIEFRFDFGVSDDAFDRACKELVNEINQKRVAKQQGSRSREMSVDEILKKYNDLFPFQKRKKGFFERIFG